MSDDIAHYLHHDFPVYTLALPPRTAADHPEWVVGACPLGPAVFIFNDIEEARGYLQNHLTPEEKIVPLKTLDSFLFMLRHARESGAKGVYFRSIVNDLVQHAYNPIDFEIAQLENQPPPTA